MGQVSLADLARIVVLSNLLNPAGIANILKFLQVLLRNRRTITLCGDDLIFRPQ